MSKLMHNVRAYTFDFCRFDNLLFTNIGSTTKKKENR